MANENRSHADYLSRASPRFREAFQRVGTVVQRIFPSAREAFECGMPGWRVPVRPPPAALAVKGTIDPRFLHILMVERKSGLTLHFWNPADYDGLERHRSALSDAGFKVMRGCVQFNRKQGFPSTALDPLFRQVKEGLAAGR